MRRPLLLAALAALSLAPAEYASAAGANCRVSWISGARVEVGDDKLVAYDYRGAFEMGDRSEFTLRDDDGFLTLAILMARWQSDGRAARNLTERVTIPTRELDAARRAGQVGTAYQASLLRSGEGGEDPSEYEARQEYFRSLAAEMKALMAKAGSGGVTVRSGYLRDRFGVMLERLAPGSPRRIEVYYIDPAKPDVANAFCDPKAPVALVGRVLCNNNFVTGAARADAICPDGVQMDDLAAAPLTPPPAED